MKWKWKFYDIEDKIWIFKLHWIFKSLIHYLVVSALPHNFEENI